MGRVVVVGSLNVDRPWRVARHPRLGETIEGEQLAPLPGGKGLNQAVAARRMGVDVAIVGRIGDDADGRWLRAVAEGAGIATDDLEVDVDGDRTEVRLADMHPHGRWIEWLEEPAGTAPADSDPDGGLG